MPNEPKLKIALVGAIDSPISKDATAGTEVWTYNFAEELVQRGHDVSLFGSSESSFSGKLVPTCSVQDIKGADGAIVKAKFSLFSVDEMVEVVKAQDQYDIIHLSVYSLHYALPLVKLLHKPLVVTIHGSSFSYEDAKLAFERFTDPHYVFISETFARNFPKPEKSTVIPNGIAVSNFEFSDNSENYYFWMSRISPEKGLSDAVQFAVKTNSELVIAGPIRNQEYFENEVKPYLTDKIRYVGELGQAEKTAYYQKAKAFLMPIKWEEPFGLVVVEALACGTPVIAYRRGAMPEIIEDGKTGFLVDPDSVAGLEEAAAKIDQLDRALCRQSVENKYSLETMVENYERYYYQILR